MTEANRCPEIALGRRCWKPEQHDGGHRFGEAPTPDQPPPRTAGDRAAGAPDRLLSLALLH